MTNTASWSAELERHTIADIKTKRIRNRYPRLYGKNAKLPEHAYGMEVMIYEITTNRGASGWGLHRRNMAARPGGLHVVNGTTFPEIGHLQGRPLNELFDPAVGTIAEEAAHLDLALHDLVGRILGIPVYEMLGSRGSTSIACYDGSIYMDDISPGTIDKGTGVILDNCRRSYEQGYRAFKLKIGRGNKWMPFEDGMKRDIEVTTLVRKHFPDCDIMVDANDGYAPDDFLRYFDAVADCGLFWIEEPFRESREDLLKLRERIAKHSPNTLVADGESRPDVEQLFQLAEEKLVDVMLMDIEYYGFTAWRKLLPRVLDSGARISPHNWGLRVKTHYTAQLAAGIQGVITIEGIPDETEGVDYSGYRMENGRIHVSGKPGFGMELEWALELKPVT